MTALLLFGLVVSVVFSALVRWLKKRRIQHQPVIIAMSCLPTQAAYLLLIFFDHTQNSEMWQFLALTYVPSSIVIFVVLSILSVESLRKEKTLGGRLKTLGVIPIYGIGSYYILLTWAYIFDFPL